MIPRKDRLPVQYSPTDIFLAGGKLYHLNLAPGDLSPYLLIVGDPGRVDLLAENFFSDLELNVTHRGLRSVTGRVAHTGQRVSVVTSGMGTSSLEIVLNELICLFEMDFAALRPKPEGTAPRITVIRLGTSGALHRDTPVGIPIISRYAVGLDNTGLFYDFPAEDALCVEIEQKVAQALGAATYPDARFKGKIWPYAAKGSLEVVDALALAAQARGIKYAEGITASASGLFVPQGKLVGRIPPTIAPIDRLLADLEPIGGLVFRNMEMESSLLFHYLRGHGHAAGSVCVGVDNPITGAFAPDTSAGVIQSAQIALDALHELEKRAGSR